MYIYQELGKQGESLACNYLAKKGYTIIARNFRCRQGEIDIIMYDKIKNELIFVEVKTRSNAKYGKPVDAVDIKKQKHIYKAACYYVYKHKIKNKFIRFDVIEVYVSNKQFKINHIKQVTM